MARVLVVASVVVMGAGASSCAVAGVLAVGTGASMRVGVVAAGWLVNAWLGVRFVGARPR